MMIKCACCNPFLFYLLGKIRRQKKVSYNEVSCFVLSFCVNFFGKALQYKGVCYAYSNCPLHNYYIDNINDYDNSQFDYNNARFGRLSYKKNP